MGEEATPVSYTSEYNTQLTQLVATINTVTDVGRVHDRPRFGDAAKLHTKRINGIDQIRAWEVAPAGTEVIRREQGRRHRYRTWQINGYIGLEDMSRETDAEAPPADEYTNASFHVAQRLAGEIADAIDLAAHTTWSADGSFIPREPVAFEEPQVATIGGGALCWTISLTATGYTIVTP